MSVQGSRRSNQTSVTTARVVKTIASLSYDCLTSICDTVYAEKQAEPKEKLPLSLEEMPQLLLHEEN